MKIDVGYISTKWYDRKTIGWWIFYFKPYKLIKGFNLRICGIHLNIRESNGTAKMIANSMKK